LKSPELPAADFLNKAFDVAAWVSE